MFFYYKYLLHIYGRNIDVIIKRFYRYVSAFYFNKSVQHMWILHCIIPRKTIYLTDLMGLHGYF